MCYNVLCDKYATRQLYGYCPSWALTWEYRKKGIMEEIVSCDADIISLQVTVTKYRALFPRGSPTGEMVHVWEHKTRALLHVAGCSVPYSDQPGQPQTEHECSRSSATMTLLLLNMVVLFSHCGFRAIYRSQIHELV